MRGTATAETLMMVSRDDGDDRSDQAKMEEDRKRLRPRSLVSSILRERGEVTVQRESENLNTAGGRGRRRGIIEERVN